jgi:phosphotransacetylase/acyl dehydratase
MQPGETIANHPFDEIKLGDQTTWSKTITRDDIAMFALLAEDATHPPIIAAGGGNAASSWAAALASALLTSRFPGPGTIFLGESFKGQREIHVGDVLTITLTVREKLPLTKSVVLDCACKDAVGADVISGRMEVKAPTEKIVSRIGILPEVKLRGHARYEQLIGRCAGLAPLPTAIVHPCDDSSITAAVEAEKAGLLRAIFVGPSAKIKAAAAKAGIDIDSIPIIDAPHSHAAAEKAVELVRAGKAQLLMKGSLHTDELLGAVVKTEAGLRTERRITHCFIMDVPTYPKPLVITDAAVNISPQLADKVDIIQNAIDLSLAMGIEHPRVAILSAIETVNPKIASTLDAAALCKMADRGQITGGILDGPLAFDNAVSKAAADIKGIQSPVAGQADILVVPNLEAGNMIYKNLSFLADSDGAGIVLGARVPIILTSRADSVRTKLASCAIGLLYAHASQPAIASAAE